MAARVPSKHAEMLQTCVPKRLHRAFYFPVRSDSRKILPPLAGHNLFAIRTDVKPPVSHKKLSNQTLKPYCVLGRIERHNEVVRESGEHAMAAMCNESKMLPTPIRVCLSSQSLALCLLCQLSANQCTSQCIFWKMRLWMTQHEE